jgi:hypothetical protein
VFITWSIRPVATVLLLSSLSWLLSYIFVVSFISPGAFTRYFSVVNSRIAMVLLLALKLVCKLFCLSQFRTFGFDGPLIISPSSDKLLSLLLISSASLLPSLSLMSTAINCLTLLLK